MCPNLHSADVSGLQITKEVKSGQYRLVSFFLARQLVSIPFETAIALLFTVIVYFMIGFQTVAAKYFIFAVTLVLVNLISEMVGFIMGVILKVCPSRLHLETVSLPLRCWQSEICMTSLAAAVLQC